MSMNLRVLAPSREHSSGSSQVQPPPWESPQWQEAVSQNPGLEPFFDNLDSFVELPEGVEKLRELFLDLAVRGKLVHQDESEGDGATLLEKVADDRIEYLKSHGLKKGKSLKPPAPEEFQVPANWTLTHLNDLAYQVHYGYTASADENLRDVRMLRITDIQNNMVNWETVPGCEIEEEKVGQYELADNDLLIARTGGTIGKTYLIQGVSVRSVFASYLIRVIPSKLVCAEYLKRFLECPFYWGQLRAKSAGTGQPNVNATSLKSLVVPLPPLAEQRRIVSKVEGLMSLCDTLESQRRSRESVRGRASRSVLASLTNAGPSASERQGASRRSSTVDAESKTPTASALSLTKKPKQPQGDSPGSESPAVKTGASAHRLMSGTETLASAWQRLSDHFEVLLDQPSGPAHLRQSILQLAVQGKLVPQDPNDEPATSVLETALAERDRMVNAKEIQKPRNIQPIDSAELRYDAPPNWTWAKLGDIGFVTKLAGFEYTKHINLTDSGEVPVIRAQNVKMDRIVDDKLKYIDLETSLQLSRCALTKPALLVTFIGAGIGDVATFDRKERWHLAPNVAKVEPFNPADDEALAIGYLQQFLMSPDGRAEIFKHKKSTAQPSLSMTTIRDINVALPPLAEQKRIVSKVSVLLSQLDELSARLRCRQSTTDALLTALIHQVLEHPS